MQYDTIAIQQCVSCYKTMKLFDTKSHTVNRVIRRMRLME